MITFAHGLFLLILLTCSIEILCASCDENEFTCLNANCIDLFSVCDGVKNCADGSDETRNVCSKMHITCQPFAFRCAYGACIDGDQKCNGVQDCADGSDENHPDCSKANPPATTANNTCSDGSFRCASGQCVSEFSVCDGTVDCRDASDENETICVNFLCEEYVGFQCSYGGCIDIDKKCNGVIDCRDGSDEDDMLCNPNKITTSSPPVNGVVDRKGCKLPREPEGGVFSVSNCNNDDVSHRCRRIPDTIVSEYTSLTYKCIEGFNLSDPTNFVRYCIDSQWYPITPIRCLPLCKPLKSISEDVICKRLDKPADCSLPVLPETKAIIKCKSSYRYISGSGISEIVCSEDGRWSDFPIRCSPECGIRTGNVAKPLISGGQVTSAIEYPWHVGLYKFDWALNITELFCGGSIISPYMILTAAHCLFESKVRIAASGITVIAGKTERSWLKKEPSEQRFVVEKMHIHSDYRGDDSNYVFDIAILELKTHIVIGRLSLPVCIEWVSPGLYIPNGTPGTAVGWGKNEKGELSAYLMSVNLSYVDQQKCYRRSDFVFRRFITHDKFCADYKNGAGVQPGDSGGGLFFIKPENKLYYVQGIVSTKPRDSNKFATFTNISAKTNMDFIKEVRRKVALRVDKV